MLFIRKSNNRRWRHSAWLYSTVFAGRISTMVVFLLFCSFMIQPIHKAIAAEPLESDTPEGTPVAEDVREQTEEVPPETTTENTDSTDSQEQITEEEPTDDDATVSEDDSTAEEGTEIEETTDSEEDTEIVDETTEETNDNESTDSEENTASTTDGASNEDSIDENDTEPEVVIQATNLVTEENYYQFSKQSCAPVGDGAYHCTTKTDADIDTQSVVYADHGADGNMEIFLKTSKNKVKQITDNAYDDTSPHYDPESMKIVWQRLIDGRQQIVLFDIMEDKETQLTFSKNNNMEPKVSKAGIVWQAWDNNDWEVMYFDGTYTEQLTDNEAQDVTPVIQDGYVLWSVLGGEEQQARVYSLDTKETSSIMGYEGGSIVNPRFVLVYDTKFENGDVITQGFDPATGLSQPIAAKPAPEPVNIPESDPTGEIRALLIQGKSQKDENEFDSSAQDDGDAQTVPAPEPGTLDLKLPGDNSSSSVTSNITLPSTTTLDNFELTEYDLVLPLNALDDIE